VYLHYLVKYLGSRNRHAQGLSTANCRVRLMNISLNLHKLCPKI